jgi:hypothetical protein
MKVVGLYKKKPHFLRSHKHLPTVDSRRRSYYQLECCEDYILELLFLKNEKLHTLIILQEAESRECFYHSISNMTRKGGHTVGRTEYFYLSFHKFAKCPCFAFIWLLAEQERLSPPWRLHIPIKVESVIALPQSLSQLQA